MVALELSRPGELPAASSLPSLLLMVSDVSDDGFL